MPQQVTIDNETILKLIEKHILESENLPKGAEVEVDEVIINMVGQVLKRNETRMFVYKKDSKRKDATFTMIASVTRK